MKNKFKITMQKQVFLLVCVVLIFSGIASAYPEYTGLEFQYYENGSCINITQLCENSTYNNITSIVSPSSFRHVFSPEQAMTADNPTDFSFATCDYSDELGYWKVNGHCDVDGSDVVWMQQYQITPTGHATELNNAWFSIGLLGLLFGVAICLLSLSVILKAKAAKIFFMLAAFVFLMGSLVISHVASVESNMPPAISSTITIMMYAFGLIFFVALAYILINQIIEAMNLYQEGKGYETEY